MYNRLFSLLIVCILLVSCETEEFTMHTETLPPSKEEQPSPFGNKEPIPYSVTNMRIALQELQANGLSKKGISHIDIQATHIYLKFIPKNDNELMLLKSDKILDVVPIPYDNDLSNFNGIYRDPTVPDGQPTYQYSVVEVGYELPNVEYQVLDSIYMPDMVELGLSKSSCPSFWRELEEKAIEVSGFEAPKQLSKKFSRSGFVRSYKNPTENYLVPNVRVHANFSVRKDDTHTDAKGEFTFSKEFSKKIHVHVYFENSDYTMNNYDTRDVCAYYAGRFSGDIPISFKKEQTTETMASMVAKGAYNVYNNCGDSLPKPPYCTVYLYPSTTTNVNDCQGLYKCDSEEKYIQIADCNQEYRTTYECAVNQFSKAALHKAMGYRYKKLSFELCDAWGLAVGWMFAQKIFGQYTPRSNSTFYNNFIIDLIDDDNSSHDKVKGYTLSQIAECLVNSNSVFELRDKLTESYDNETEQYIEDLIFYWLGY